MAVFLPRETELLFDWNFGSYRSTESFFHSFFRLGATPLSYEYTFIEKETLNSSPKTQNKKWRFLATKGEQQKETCWMKILTFGSKEGGDIWLEIFTFFDDELRWCVLIFLICWYEWILIGHKFYFLSQTNDKKFDNNPIIFFVKSPMNCRKDFQKTTNICLWIYGLLYAFAGCSCSCSHHRPISVQDCIFKHQHETCQQRKLQQTTVCNQADKGQLTFVWFIWIIIILCL